MSSACQRYLKLQIFLRSRTKRVYQIKGLEQGLRPPKFKGKEENDKQAKGMGRWLVREKENLEAKGESA